MKRETGGTLAELGVVLGVISAIIVMAAPPLFLRLPSLRADRAAEEIAAQMRLVRARAVREGRAYRFEFFSGEDRYRFCPDPRGKGCVPGEAVGEVDLGERYPGIGFGTVKGLPRTSGDEIIAPSGIHFPEGTVHFRPDGSASRAGSVYLIPEEDRPQSPRRMRAVTVLFTTGRVKLWRYDPSAADPTRRRGPWRAY